MLTNSQSHLQLPIHYEVSLKKDGTVDLGTIKDSQYVVAENILLKKFRVESNNNSYHPLKSNLGYALKKVKTYQFSYIHTSQE